ncbi:PSP1 domain-containing protein [Mucisphaera sp.]|uniref:PSP1 domain-containing protein n=1 Tax=Mucisphaera sp. TaxID=2913024 RepID=UPI003D12A5FF
MPGSITPLPIMLSEEDQAVYDSLEAPKTIVVKYGYQKKIAEFPYDGDAKPGCGSKMVIRTDRGTEIGEMLTTTCSNSGCGKSISRSQMLDYIKNSGGKDYPFTKDGRILRVATPEDLIEQNKLDARKPEFTKLAKRLINELNLDMKLVDVEPLLGGERILFYYASEDWVDFRELVKQLAAELHTRIEMLQVNAREEARLVADYEKCGQHCCCKQFLKVLKPISMRSAKIQKATLDPQKISGRCGRLMCCLRYEDKTYDELRKKLPHKKTVVETEDGIGIVLDSQILTQLVLVRIGPNPPAAYPLENIRRLDKDEANAWRKQMQEEERERAEAWAARSARRTERRGGPPAQTGRSQRPADAPPRDNEEKDQQNDAGEQRKPRRRRRSRRPRSDQQAGDNRPQAADPNASSPENNPSTDPNASGDAPRKKRRRRRRRRGGGGDGSDTPNTGGPPPTE